VNIKWVETPSTIREEQIDEIFNILKEIRDSIKSILDNLNNIDEKLSTR